MIKVIGIGAGLVVTSLPFFYLTYGTWVWYTVPAMMVFSGLFMIGGIIAVFGLIRYISEK